VWPPHIHRDPPLKPPSPPYSFRNLINSSWGLTQCQSRLLGLQLSLFFRAALRPREAQHSCPRVTESPPSQEQFHSHILGVPGSMNSRKCPTKHGKGSKGTVMSSLSLSLSLSLPCGPYCPLLLSEIQGQRVWFSCPAGLLSPWPGHRCAACSSWLSPPRSQSWRLQLHRTSCTH
jgi:hypothetical protein